MKYCVTVQRLGILFVEADGEEEVFDIANHQTTDTVNWSDDWTPTDAVKDDTQPANVYISERAFN